MPKRSKPPLHSSRKLAIPALLVLQVFEKTVSLLKSEYTDVYDAATEVLSSTNYNIVGLLIKVMAPVLKEATDNKSDIGVKKKKKRDTLLCKVLLIFYKISASGRLRESVATAKDLQLFNPLMEFLEACKTQAISNLDVKSEVDTCRMHFAWIIHGICIGLHEVQNTKYFSALNRASYYKMFENFLDASSEHNVHLIAYKTAIIHGIYGLLFSDDILSNYKHMIEVKQVIATFNQVLQSGIPNADNITLKLLEVVVHFKESYPEIITWLISKHYQTSGNFSLQIFYLILNYFDTNSNAQKIMISVLCMIFLTSQNVNSTKWLRIQKTLGTINKLLTISQPKMFSFGDDVSSISVMHYQNFTMCHEHVTEYLVRNFSDSLGSIIFELFKILSVCEVSHRVNVLVCLDVLFRRITITNHSEFDLFIKEHFEESEEVVRKPVTFDEGISIINNLLYITHKFNLLYSLYLKSCWISLCCCSNVSFYLTLNYLEAIAQYESSLLHDVIKKVIGFLYPIRDTYTFNYLIEKLQNEKIQKLHIEVHKIAPHVRVFTNFPYTSAGSPQKLLSRGGINQSQGVTNSTGMGSMWENRLLPFHELFKLTTESIIPLPNVYLMLLCSIMPACLKEVNHNFIIILHLSIHRIYNHSNFVSNACKMNLIHLFSFLMENSNLDLNIKSSVLFGFSVSLCSLELSEMPAMVESKQNQDQFELKDEIASKLLNSILLAKCSKTDNEGQIVICDLEGELHGLVNSIVAYIRYCGYEALIDQCWCTCCIFFATKSSSVNVCCFSLSMLRIFNRLLDSGLIKSLILYFCTTLTNVNGNTDIKKLNRELFNTLFTMGANLISHIVKSESEVSKDNEFHLQLYIWFFTNCLRSVIHEEFGSMTIEFFLQLFSLPNSFLMNCFETLQSKVHLKGGLLYHCLRHLVSSVNFNQPCLDILFHLSNYVDCKFVAENRNVGICLVGLILAYLYVDYFSQPAPELPDCFSDILEKLVTYQNTEEFRKILVVFKMPIKRKDVDVFLEMLYNQIFSLCSCAEIKVLLKFLSDSIVYSDSMICVGRSLTLFNFFFKYVGFQNVPCQVIEMLSGILIKYVKMSTFTKKIIDLSKSIHMGRIEPPSQACPHEHMEHNFKNNPKFTCLLCGSNSEDTITCTDFNFLGVNDVDFFCSTVNRIGELGKFDSDDEDTIANDPLFFDISPEYGVQIKKSDHQEDTNTTTVDSRSINSNQMINDIIETINYLDEEFNKNDFCFNESGGEVPPVQSSTLKNHYHSIDSLKSYTFSFSNSPQPADDLLDSPRCLTPQKTSRIEHRAIQSEMNISSLIEPTFSEQAYDKSSCSMTNSSNVHMPEEMEDAIEQQYLRTLAPCLSFANKDALKTAWRVSFMQCVYDSKNDMSLEATIYFFRVNFLIPITMYHFYYLTTLLMDDLYSGAFSQIRRDHQWIMRTVIVLQRALDQVFKDQQLPYLIFSFENNFIKNFTCDRYFSILIRMTTTLHEFFEYWSLLNDYKAKKSDISPEFISKFVQKLQSSMIAMPLFNKSFVISSEASMLSQLVNDQDCGANFVTFILFEILRLFGDFIDHYSVYYRDISNQTGQKNCCDITKDGCGLAVSQVSVKSDEIFKKGGNSLLFFSRLNDIYSDPGTIETASMAESSSKWYQVPAFPINLKRSRSSGFLCCLQSDNADSFNQKLKKDVDEDEQDYTRVRSHSFTFGGPDKLRCFRHRSHNKFNTKTNMVLQSFRSNMINNVAVFAKTCNQRNLMEPSDHKFLYASYGKIEALLELSDTLSKVLIDMLNKIPNIKQKNYLTDIKKEFS